MQVELAPEESIGITKYCPRCKETKVSSEFYPKNREQPTKLAVYCKECNRKISRKFYCENKESHKHYVKERYRDLRQAHFDYLKTQKCAHCGEEDPIVLEFHHIDRTKKEYSLNRILKRQNFNAYLAERSKCIILCANCHRRVTAKQLGYYKDIIL